MKATKLTAPLLRIVLSVTLVLITVGGFFVWKTGHDIINKVASDVSKTHQLAISSANDLQSLQGLQSQLDNHADTITKASALIAESKGYQYQNQITEDLQNFANASNIGIQSYTFAASGAAGASGASGAPASAVPTGTSTIAGLKTVTETIQLAPNFNYTSYLQFINDIQNNSLKMQITGLSLSYSSAGLASQALTITAFTQ